jgi:hypothetical protein
VLKFEEVKHRILVGRSEITNIFIITKRREEDNIKMNLQAIG